MYTQFAIFTRTISDTIIVQSLVVCGEISPEIVSFRMFRPRFLSLAVFNAGNTIRISNFTEQTSSLKISVSTILHLVCKTIAFRNTPKAISFVHSIVLFRYTFACVRYTAFPMRLAPTTITYETRAARGIDY